MCYTFIGDSMYGAIIGDLAGSIYEFDQVKEVKPVIMDKIIENNAFFSDDTILTIAVLDAINNNGDYDKYLRKYINLFSVYKPDFSPYFKSSFSPGIIKWAKSDDIGFSKGHGAMMRISPVGYMFDSCEDVINNSVSATVCSHNSDEAIDSAVKVALTIFYLRHGLDKKEIFEKLDITKKFSLFTKFNTTCMETIDNCFYVLDKSYDFEDAIRKTLLLGGDTDTNCCIVGSMAEAAFGIDKELIDIASSKIPSDFQKVLVKSKVYDIK